MPGPVLTKRHVVFILQLQGAVASCTDSETEARKGRETAHCRTAGRRRSWGFQAGAQPPETLRTAPLPVFMR